MLEGPFPNSAPEPTNTNFLHSGVITALCAVVNVVLTILYIVRDDQPEAMWISIAIAVGSGVVSVTCFAAWRRTKKRRLDLPTKL